MHGWKENLCIKLTASCDLIFGTCALGPDRARHPDPRHGTGQDWNCHRPKSRRLARASLALVPAAGCVQQHLQVGRRCIDTARERLRARREAPGHRLFPTSFGAAALT